MRALDPEKGVPGTQLWEALEELWEGLGELWDVSERINISKNSRSTAPAAVNVNIIIMCSAQCVRIIMICHIR